MKSATNGCEDENRQKKKKKSQLLTTVKATVDLQGITAVEQSRVVVPPKYTNDLEKEQHYLQARSVSQKFRKLLQKKCSYSRALYSPFSPSRGRLKTYYLSRKRNYLFSHIFRVHHLSSPKDPSGDQQTLEGFQFSIGDVAMVHTINNYYY